jgi:hypothetical protein
MTGWIKSFGTLLIIAMLTGCMTFELEGDGEKTTRSPHGKEIVQGSLYGYRWREWDIEKCADGAGIYRVEYQTNALFLLAAVGSLGLYVPQGVEWWCQAPPPGPDGPLLQPTGSTTDANGAQP